MKPAPKHHTAVRSITQK